MPDLLKPLAPLSHNITTPEFRQEISLLCQNLMTPGFAIPSGSDKRLADALLGREISRTMLVPACMNVLKSNAQVVSFLDHAWTRNEPALDGLLADGTLVSFLNSSLMQALLMTSPIPNLAVERLLTHVRRRLLDCALDPDWHSNTATHQCATALSVHAFLTEYIFFESENEHQKVEQLCAKLDSTPTDALDPFDVAIAGCYRSLGSREFGSRVSQAPRLVSDPAMQMLARIQIVEPARERQLIDTINTVTEIKEETSHLVRSLYEENPYPRWTSFTRNDAVSHLVILRNACMDFDESVFGSSGTISILVAGCGTGLTAIEVAALFEGAQIQAVDLSLASLAFAKRCAEEMQLGSIEFSQADILELPKWVQTFDYIESTGVLHHMKDPIEGLRALVDVCRPGGVLRIGLYSAASRRNLSSAVDFMRTQSDGMSLSGIQAARQTLINFAHQTGECDDRFISLFSTLDFYTTSMCRDLLFHVHEIDFTIPMIEKAVNDLGLRFCGFVDVDGERLKSYSVFAPHDPNGLDLKSRAKYEAENPDAFSSMYDFMVQKPA